MSAAYRLNVVSAAREALINARGNMQIATRNARDLPEASLTAMLAAEAAEAAHRAAYDTYQAAWRFGMTGE